METAIILPVVMLKPPVSLCPAKQLNPGLNYFHLQNTSYAFYEFRFNRFILVLIAKNLFVSNELSPFIKRGTVSILYFFCTHILET